MANKMEVVSDSAFIFPVIALKHAIPPLTDYYIVFLAAALQNLVLVPGQGM